MPGAVRVDGLRVAAGAPIPPTATLMSMVDTAAAVLGRPDVLRHWWAAAAPGDR